MQKESVLVTFLELKQIPEITRDYEKKLLCLPVREVPAHDWRMWQSKNFHLMAGKQKG
jgi:hypothetical protein